MGFQPVSIRSRSSRRQNHPDDGRVTDAGVATVVNIRENMHGDVDNLTLLNRLLELNFCVATGK